MYKRQLQRCVTLSTAEAEYYAAAEAARTLQWIQRLALEWKIPLPNPLPLHVDNTAAISMASANGATTRSKHIDTKAHFLRELVHRGVVHVSHIPGSRQLADLFTKPLPSVKFQTLLSLIRNPCSRLREVIRSTTIQPETQVS